MPERDELKNIKLSLKTNTKDLAKEDGGGERELSER